MAGGVRAFMALPFTRSGRCCASVEPAAVMPTPPRKGWTAPCDRACWQAETCRAGGRYHIATGPLGTQLRTSHPHLKQRLPVPHVDGQRLVGQVLRKVHAALVRRLLRRLAARQRLQRRVLQEWGRGAAQTGEVWGCAIEVQPNFERVAHPPA
eukprot:130728-Chlamydomonas_euryale.AAC.1